MAAKYPQGPNAASYGGPPPTQPAALAAAAEEAEAVSDKRRELFTLFRNIAKICFGEALGFVGAVLGALLPRQDVAWQVRRGPGGPGELGSEATRCVCVTVSVCV